MCMGRGSSLVVVLIHEVGQSTSLTVWQQGQIERQTQRWSKITTNLANQNSYLPSMQMTDRQTLDGAARSGYDRE